MTRKPRIYMKFLVFYVVFQSIIKVFVFGETNKYSSKTTVEQVNLSDYRKTLGNDAVCYVSCKNIYKTRLWTVAFHPSFSLGCGDSVVASAASGPAVGPGGGVLAGGVLAGGGAGGPAVGLAVGGAATDHSHGRRSSRTSSKSGWRTPATALRQYCTGEGRPPTGLTVPGTTGETNVDAKSA